MQVPAFMTSWTEDGLVCSDGWFDGPRIGTGHTAGPLEAVASEGVVREQRCPAVIVDVPSLSGRFFDEKVMKNMRLRGADIWFMTHIEDADDVFDAFNTNADMVIAPYHTVRSDTDLEDIHSVSDCVIPAIYSVNGEGLVRRRRTDRIVSILDRLADMGFYRTCVVDTDGSIPKDVWSDIRDGFPSSIPFVERTDRIPDGFGMDIVRYP